ncbi:restriction endonuclease [Streptomyces sp. NPDC006879]|uniref:restriction endonuclease n=1 Tax=Streptomyces sp. NPDC006879 TaxID=3364767 RepID=UPI0036960C34
MINSTTPATSSPDFGDLVASFFSGNNFDPSTPPSLGDLLGNWFDETDTRRNREAIKSNLATVRRNAQQLDELLDIASRRLFLTDRHETAVTFFEELAGMAPGIRRLIGRLEELLEKEQGADLGPVIEDANAWVQRIEEIREAAEAPHRAAVGQRFREMYQLHHREFEHRIAQLLNFDGFTIERWNGGAGDLAADIVCRLPDGDDRRAIVQCKHTSDPWTNIGSGVIQQVSGARQAHEAELPIVVTMGAFTKPAATVAKKLNVLLVNGSDVLQWALGGMRVLDLLEDQMAA